MIPSKGITPDSSNQVHSQDALSVQKPSHATNWATLYPELIYEIFTHCLSGVTLSTGAPGLFPWYLGHICQPWRSVFISSPRFWDRFTFEETPNGERALALIELCIERTKDHPFSFKFNDIGTRVAHSLHRSQILETLVAHADRWHAAYFQFLAYPDGLEKTLIKAKGRFGRLHSFQNLTFGATPPHPSDLLQDAPNLTRVCTAEYYELRWSSITVLHINLLCNAHMFFAKLDKMTCLEELVVRNLPPYYKVANTSPIELPSLKIFIADNHFPALFIKALALEKLYLAGPLLPGHVLAIETLLSTASHLKTLSLRVHDDDLVKIIDCMPELDHLILYWGMIPLDAFQSLLGFLASHSTARSLRRISIGVRSLQLGESIHALMTIIKPWEKHQFPKLCFMSVHVYDNPGKKYITSAIADLIQVGGDKGIEIAVNSTPFPRALPFESW